MCVLVSDPICNVHCDQLLEAKAVEELVSLLVAADLGDHGTCLALHWQLSALLMASARLSEMISLSSACSPDDLIEIFSEQRLGVFVDVQSATSRARTSIETFSTSKAEELRERLVCNLRITEVGFSKPCNIKSVLHCFSESAETFDLLVS